jgi:signal recognition particle subunit SRP54
MFENLQDRLGSILNNLTGRGALSEKDVSEAMREVRRALLEADVALEVVRGFTDRVRDRRLSAPRSSSRSSRARWWSSWSMTSWWRCLEKKASSRSISMRAAPVVIMMVGLQGSGKTTTSAKIAARLMEKRDKRKKVLMASLDTRRPAAQEQLKVLGEQTGVATLPIIAGQAPTEIAARAMQAAKLGGYDVVILDTAGRTHIDEAADGRDGRDQGGVANPHEILLVADSLTGQDAVNLARSFRRARRHHRHWC